uniref:Uncharacterized protein n=1 Tax=Vitis vinifera TaxID=29760 RepID=A5AN27_VITVI|nr:hypothetical protein VITISV_026203 [Vitis vinifera]
MDQQVVTIDQFTAAMTSIQEALANLSISRSLWTNSSPVDVKGNKPSGGQQSVDEPGHETDRCIVLRHAIQDLIDQGLVHLGQSSVTTNPLPSHITHAIPSSADDIHFLDFAEFDDHIHMLSWDESALEPMVSDEIYEMGRVTLSPRVPTPFRLIPKAALVAQTPFVLITDVEEVQTPYVDDVHIPDIHTHREALIRAQSQIRVETTTTPEGLIHMVTAGRATCIAFSDDDLPPDGSDHIRLLYISVQTLEMKDFCRNFVAMSFDQHDNTVVLDMMRIDYRYMARLRKERVRVRLTHTPFDYPIRPYTMSLVDYFRRASGPQMPLDGIIGGLNTIQEIGDIVDGVIPHDVYIDEMLVMSMSQIKEIVRPEFAMPFNLFGLSAIEIAKEIQTVLTPKFTKDDIVDVLFNDPVGSVEGEPTLWTHFFHLMFYRDLSPVLTISYLDVFTWSYEHMPSLDPFIVQHRLPLLPHAKPVKQKLRRLHSRWSLQVKEEIQKQLNIGFLSMVEYPEWLANVVPIPKKDDNVRVCVDFQDLNKASSKDDFPFPHIDMLVDSTKDDMIVKSGDRADHLAALERFFERIRQFRLRLNPKKCTFGVTSRKLLGYMISERGIEADPDKIKVILNMFAPRTEREIRGFLGRLQYISRFIARLADICEPIFRLLRKSQSTIWDY